MSRTAEWQIPKADEVLREIAAVGGQSLNASEVGRRLGLSCHAVRHRITALEKAGAIRVLPSLAGRRPHVLLRDCRLLQEFGAGRVAVMRAFLTEQIMTILSGNRWLQWEAGRVKRVDLVASNLQRSIGFRFTERAILRNRDVEPLRLCLRHKVVGHGFLVYCGAHAFVAARMILALPIEEFLCNLEEWLACRSFQEALDVLRRRKCCAPFFDMINTLYPWRGCT